MPCHQEGSAGLHLRGLKTERLSGAHLVETSSGMSRDSTPTDHNQTPLRELFKETILVGRRIVFGDLCQPPFSSEPEDSLRLKLWYELCSRFCHCFFLVN